MNLTPTEIFKKIMMRFDLGKEDAEDFVEKTWAWNSSDVEDWADKNAYRCSELEEISYRQILASPFQF